MILVDMPLPETCWLCPFDRACMKWLVDNERPDDCPLVEVDAPVTYEGKVIGYVNEEKYNKVMLEALGVEFVKQT